MDRIRRETLSAGDIEPVLAAFGVLAGSAVVIGPVPAMAGAR